MNEIVPIRFEHVTKQFSLGTSGEQTILEKIISFVTRAPKSEQQAFHAAKDISFEILKGQCVGIVGRNGGGKSTLLKLVARILYPDSGTINVNGRVSALLELGTGFQGDLSGRENIYLNGSILGLKRHEIEQYFDSIVEFSELEEFIDLPVKFYSSGMYMRLGFSVAIHVNPDILIIDEILTVGDQAFQQKCIDHIYKMKQTGITILLVSHQLDMVRKLCSHLLWIEKGNLRMQGPTAQVAAAYEEFSLNRTLIKKKAPTKFVRWGTEEIEIRSVTIRNQHGETTELFHTGDSLTVAIRYHAHKPILNPEFGLAIHHENEAHINGPNSRLYGLETGELFGTGVIEYEIHKLPLLVGRYYLTVAIHDSRLSIAYDYHELAYQFKVIPTAKEQEQSGLFSIPASWRWIPDEVKEIAE